MRFFNLILCGVAVAALAGFSFALPVAAQAQARASAPASSAVSITAGDTAFGRVLFTGGGRALYYYSFQAAGPCTGSCATAWPPLLAPTADGPFQVGRGVDRAELGTTPITDASGATVFQVTYFGQPLFQFAGDTAPRDTNGENIASFNAYWHLVGVDGAPQAGTATVNLESSPDGPALSTPTAGGTFRSLYELSLDPPFSTQCTGACAAVWPPLLTQRPVAKAGAGVSPRGIGFIRRPDGTFQVTYFGRPVYLFAFDLGAGAASGLTTGADLIDPQAFGVWHLLSPAGAAAAGGATIGSETVAGLGQIAATPGSAFDTASFPSPFTVYTFTRDSHRASACLGACARTWVPVLTGTTPQALSGSGISQADLGTVRRPDGTHQVTFEGHPLYTFSQDGAGTAAGAGVKAFGGTFETVSL